MKRCRKIKYLSKDNAYAAQRRQRQRTGDVTLVYRCPKCHGYHIGRPNFRQHPDICTRNLMNLFSKIGERR